MSENYIIYRFVCKDGNCKANYIGSTKSFRQRKSAHKSACLRGDKYKIYETIRANGGWDSWDMVPVEEFKCENKIQAKIREQEWIDYYSADMNMIRSHLSEDQLRQYHKMYYIENKKKIIEQAINYYENNKNHVLQYQARYRAENADAIKEYQAKYKEANREKIREYMRNYMRTYKQRKAQQTEV